MKYIDKLITSCHHAKEAQPIQQIEITNITDLSVLDGIQKGTYFIEEVDGDAEETFRALAAYKGSNDRSCPRINQASTVMYVGSSRTNVKKRISQHVGYGPKSTHALHLSHWFNGDYKITVTSYDVTDEVLQILEDDLADQLKPAFGKRGGNNR